MSTDQELELKQLNAQKETVKRILNTFYKADAKKTFTSHHFEEAEKFQASNDYFNALINWNKVLANMTSKHDFSYVYNKRSIIYKECKLYKECLNNIMMAEGHNTSQQEDLSERKEFCELAIEQQSENKDDEYFLKLSYPPNPKMPFAIDCLKLKNNLIFGNHIITDQDLNIGDVICIENPFFANLSNNNEVDSYEKDSCFQRCYHCFKYNNMNLIPCNKCNFAMFCSITCQDKAREIYHKYECVINIKLDGVKDIVRSMRSFFLTLYLYDGNFHEMKASFVARDFKVKTVYDCDLSDPTSSDYARNLMHIFDSYNAPKKNKPLSIIETIFNCHPDLAEIWEGNETFIMAFLCRHVDNLRELEQVMIQWPGNTTQLISKVPEKRNNFHTNLIRNIIGVGYYPFVGLFNHACVQNIFRHFNDKNQIVLIVCRPINKGEQLFDDYT